MRTTTKTETAGTIHGDVAYETVECTNCENDILAEEATYVGIGLYEKDCHGVNICDATHDSYRETIPFCDYCSKELLGYSGGLRQEITRPKSRTGWLLVLVAAAFGVGLGYVIGVDLVLALIYVLSTAALAVSLIGIGSML